MRKGGDAEEGRSSGFNSNKAEAVDLFLASYLASKMSPCQLLLEEEKQPDGHDVPLMTVVRGQSIGGLSITGNSLK